eukprot:UN04464
MPLNMSVSMIIVGVGLGVRYLGAWGSIALADAFTGDDYYHRRAAFNASAWWQPERIYRHMIAAGTMPYHRRALPAWMKESATNWRKYKDLNRDWDGERYNSLPKDSVEYEFQSMYRPFSFSDEWQAQVKKNQEKFDKYLTYKKKWIETKRQQQAQ